LTLSLAYEEIARNGQGLEPIDSASLASLGVGYKITRTASVTLSYSLLEYSNHLFDGPPLRDRVAETAVSIGF
jgi:long-subunit fatty acid transport protein